MKTYVLDTSALLNDPEALFAFPKAQVVIPQAVLSELDRLKMTRADKSMIYRGREVSRLLFSLSNKGKLSEGVTTDQGAVVKVAPADFPLGVPSGLNLKNADDVILATVYTISKQDPGQEVTLVTNDLNMLVKAHTLGVAVERMEEKPVKEGFFTRVFLRRRIQLALGVLTLLIVALAGSLAYIWWRGTLPSIMPGNVIEQEEFHIREEGFKRVLKSNPNDLQALVGLGDLYYKNRKYSQAVIYYRRAVALDPEDVELRTKTGNAYLDLGYPDVALREYEKVLETDPSYAAAHYFSGLAFEKKSLPAEAIKQYELYLEIEPRGSHADDARQRIERLKGS